MRESSMWILDVVALIILTVTLAIHLLNFSSLITGSGYIEALTHSQVLVRARSSLYAFSSILLLGSVLYHSLYRFRLMLLELPLAERLEKAVLWTCLTTGSAVFLYGVYMTIAALGV